MDTPSDPLDVLLGNLEKARAGIRAIKELRDDLRRAMSVIDNFNKKSDQMIRILDKLTRVLERNEDNVRRLINQLERLDKNMSAFASFLNLLGEEESRGERKQ